nr:type II toxin-antitoxin system RelE/ParE family toxin [Vibrio owensii]
MEAKVLYTQTFENTAIQSINYLSNWSARNDVIDRLIAVQQRFEHNVLNNPSTYPPCYELTTIGVYDIRQFSFDGFKLLYRIGDKNTIYALVILSDKQNLQNALIDHCIMFK